jgi:hypothetical protein
MSILNLLTNRSKVAAAAKKTVRARKREGDVAQQLFQEAFQGFQAVVSSDPVIADALYHWGFALFHQAQTKSGEEADKIYQEADSKFAFCMTMNPQHLGAAIDWGATLMEQARLRDADARAALYALAQEKFIAANAIQAGSASYNLACIAAICGDYEACRTALLDAREHGSLPGIGAILNDADLARVHQQRWFEDFMASLEEPPSEAATGAPVEAQPQAVADAASTAEKIPAASEDVVAADVAQQPGGKKTRRTRG